MFLSGDLYRKLTDACPETEDGVLVRAYIDVEKEALRSYISACVLVMKINQKKISGTMVLNQQTSKITSSGPHRRVLGQGRPGQKPGHAAPTLGERRPPDADVRRGRGPEPGG